MKRSSAQIKNFLYTGNGYNKIKAGLTLTPVEALILSYKEKPYFNVFALQKEYKNIEVHELRKAVKMLAKDGLIQVLKGSSLRASRYARNPRGTLFLKACSLSNEDYNNYLTNLKERLNAHYSNY